MYGLNLDECSLIRDLKVTEAVLGFYTFTFPFSIPEVTCWRILNLDKRCHQGGLTRGPGRAEVLRLVGLRAKTGRKWPKIL